MIKEYILIKEIEKLKSIRGNGTELISMYISAGSQINDAISRLRAERSTSSNIKSKTVRNNVLGAIDKIVHYLGLYKQTPNNGMAIFCGNISGNIELFSLEPPEPMKVDIYRCDSSFLLDPLEDIVEASDSFLLVVLDGREATIGLLKGYHIQVIKRLNSTAHAKIGKGGQSQRRFQRGVQESIDDYYKRIISSINEIFELNHFKIVGLIIGGPGPAKEGLLKQGSLNYQIKVLGVFNTGYTDEFGLRELMENAKDILIDQKAIKEISIIEKFKDAVSNRGMGVYKYEQVKKALIDNNVDILIINPYETFSKGFDETEELIKIADKNSVETIFVSAESSQGKEFTIGFGGIGAILKRKL